MSDLLSLTVPPEVRANILSYLPPGEASYGARTMQIDAETLIDQMTELGLDPAEIIAVERAKQREERSPARRLFLILRAYTPSNVNMPYPFGNELRIVSSNADLMGAIQQAGFRIRPFAIPFHGGNYYFSVINGARLYNDIVQIFERLGPNPNAGFGWLRFG